MIFKLHLHSFLSKYIHVYIIFLSISETKVTKEASSSGWNIENELKITMYKSKIEKENVSKVYRSFHVKKSKC